MARFDVPSLNILSSTSPVSFINKSLLDAYEAIVLLLSLAKILESEERSGKAGSYTCAKGLVRISLT